LGLVSQDIAVDIQVFNTKAFNKLFNYPDKLKEAASAYQNAMGAYGPQTNSQDFTAIVRLGI